MKQSKFTILDHTGDSIYKSKPQNESQYLINSFCILNKTTSSIFFKTDLGDIDLKKVKEYDKINNKKLKSDLLKDSPDYYFERKNFIENTFYNSVLKNKNNFGNIHKDVSNFKMLQKQDKSQSSLYYHVVIINNLNESGDLEKMEKKIKKRLDDIEKDNYKKENYSLISTEYMCYKKGKDFNFYRRVKANGNSFYISFLYQYMYNLIKKGEESLISEIFYIMDKELNILNNDKEQLNNQNCINSDNNLGEKYMSISNSIKNNEFNNLALFFTFFSLLYNNVVEKKIDEAEQILDYAFNYEETFSNFFCAFMKIQIKKFIIINKEVFTYEKYCKENNLIDKKYFKNGNFLYEEYINNYLLLLNQMEPTLFIISLCPYVFNVSMNLYINEENHSFEKISFDLKDQLETNITISILYSSYSYHIVVNDKKYITNKGANNIDVSNTLNLDKEIYNNFNINDYVSYVKKGKTCNECKNSQYILLKNISVTPVCLNCLKKVINETLVERYGKMITERFRFLEFYLRDIPLKLINDNDSSNYMFLSPYEFYCIFNTNIFTYFRDLIQKTCDLCRKLRKDIIKKSCDCKRCINCAKIEVQNILLTDFEKNYIYKNKKIKCSCEKEISYVDYSSQIYKKLNKEEQNKLLEKLIFRIKDNCKKYCMYCGNDLENNNLNKKIEIKIGEELVEHYICENCEKNRKSNECVICSKVHFNDSKIQNNKIGNKNDKHIIKENIEINNLNKKSSGIINNIQDSKEGFLNSEINNEKDTIKNNHKNKKPSINNESIPISDRNNNKEIKENNLKKKSIKSNPNINNNKNKNDKKNRQEMSCCIIY